MSKIMSQHSQPASSLQVAVAKLGTRLLAACLMPALSSSAVAGGTSALGVPTKIEIVRSEGFLIVGEFGNPGGCTFGNQLFVKSDHPQYKQIYAAAMSAYLSKAKVSAYVHGCEPVVWYSAAPNTFNVVYSYSSLAISD